VTEWSEIYIIDTEIPSRAKNALIAEYGDAVTLGDIADVPLRHLRDMTGIGESAVQAIVDAVAEAMAGAVPKASMSVLDAALEKVNNNV
jgi:hypothetical protein